MYSISTRNTSQRNRPGQVFSFNTRQLRNQVSTDEGSPADDDSYLGYSVATGEFNGDSDMDIAVGMPRGANLTGKVVLYNSNLTNLNNLTGDQIGAYFGYSIATCDLNGDGLDDILIGSPMWTDYSIMGKFETGRVYVVYQDKNNRFRKWDTLDGENHKARFGMSIASLGNINLDGISTESPGGFQDFAVGAPYDGPNQRGAVYIFLGSRDGVMKKPSQVIFASNLNANLKTFGWSLSGGMDMDDNKYPDLLVGAYHSGHAVHMRSAPVVHMTASVSFDENSKQIDLEDLKCTLRDRSRVPCVQVSVSLKYTGIGVPNKMDFSLDYNLDAKKEKQKRLFLLQEEGKSAKTRTISMLKDREFKETFKVYLLGSKIHDKLTSLDIQMRYSLSSQALASTTQGLIPVLGHGDHLATDSLNIQKECGADNICIPNLSIQTKEIDSYLMGSGERLEIQTVINNSGEDAFNAVLEVQLPRGVSYINANTTDPGISILCSPPTPLNNNTVQCEVGNPLRANREITTRVFVQPSSEGLEDPVSEFSFAILAKSSNPEEGSDDNDNWATYTVPIRVETDFRVTGKSNPAQVEYNISAPLPDRYDYEDEIGEAVNHIYDVKNKGPSSISEAEVYILWPSFNEYGDHLLYLLGFDYDRKKAFCEPIKNLNPLAVKVQGSRDYSASHQIGEQSTAFGSSSSSSSSYYSSSSSSQSSSGSSSQGFGGRSNSFSEEEDEESVSRVVGAARGPGDYHGTMSKAELERQAGGSVFSSSGSRTQVDNTQYRGQAKYQPPIVAEGAEETRLFDTQGQLSGSSSSSGGVKKVETSGSSSSSSFSSSSGASGSSSGNGGSHSDVVYSGWKLLDNGTYIRVYDSQSAGSAGVGNIGSVSGSGQSQGGFGRGQTSSSSQSSSSQEVKLTGSGSSAGGSYPGSSSVDLSGNSVEDGDQGSHNTGWVRQPDGTYLRKQSSWSSWSSSSGGLEGQGSMSGGGYSSQRGQSSGGSVTGGGYSSGGGQSISSGGSYSSGGDIGGGQSSSSGGSYSSGSVSGGGYSSGRGQSSSSGSEYSSDTVSGGAYNSGSYFGSDSSREQALGTSRGYGSGSAGSFSSSSNSAETTSLGGGQQGSGNLNVLIGAAGGPGDYHGTISKAELEREAGGAIFSAGRGSETGRQVHTTQYQGSRYNEDEQNQNTLSGGYNGQGYNAGESYNSGSRGGGSYSGGTGGSISGSSGGSYSGSSGSTYTAGGGGGYSSGGSYSAGSSESSQSVSSGSSSGSEGSSDDVVVTNGGKWVWSVVNDKWEWEAAPTVASDSAGRNSGNVVDSGSQDSGWVQLANGTWTRKSSSWSSSSQSGVRYGAGEAGGVGTGTLLSGDEVASHISSGNIVQAGGNGGELGHQGTNSTGWVEMPDGTMVKKSSSWASWSSSSYDRDTPDNSLEHIQRQLETKVRTNLDRNMPANVEPGFENEYRRSHRSIKSRPKRSLAEFQSELESCGSSRCTIIKCTIGPLEKDESVLFKVRSRLFTETQVKNYAEKVKISSKLVTRVTKLPFLVDEKHLAFQSHAVTTTVIPSEPGEAGIPWWVWLLAALGGILLLALITYCLYKCGFFKRRRPEDGPETEPLNGKSNGY